MIVWWAIPLVVTLLVLGMLVTMRRNTLKKSYGDLMYAGYVVLGAGLSVGMWVLAALLKVLT